MTMSRREVGRESVERKLWSGSGGICQDDFVGLERGRPGSRCFVDSISCGRFDVSQSERFTSIQSSCIALIVSIQQKQGPCGGSRPLTDQQPQGTQPTTNQPTSQPVQYAIPSKTSKTTTRPARTTTTIDSSAQIRQSNAPSPVGHSHPTYNIPSRAPSTLLPPSTALCAQCRASYLPRITSSHKSPSTISAQFLTYPAEQHA